MTALFLLALTIIVLGVCGALLAQYRNRRSVTKRGDLGRMSDDWPWNKEEPR